jgi:isoleucyl-tRNA synthetase
VPLAERPLLDRWLIASSSGSSDGHRRLEEYDATNSGQGHPGVRRRPLQLVRAPQPSPLLEERERRDKLAAYHTLYETLVTLAKLLAPFTPFIAEELYQNLVRSVDESAPESVHLTSGRRGSHRHALDRAGRARASSSTASSS